MILIDLGIGKFFAKVTIALVTGIYYLVRYAYEIFLILAKTNIFEQSQYEQLTTKIYVILGVVMLFVIAYNILNVVVDPDKNKGGAVVEKLLRNIIISFILIVICPTIFSFAFRFQDAVLVQDTIGKFFNVTGIDGYEGNNTIKSGGNMMAVHTFSAFFTPKSSSGTYTEGLDEQVTSDDDCSTTGAKCTLQEAKQLAEEKGDFSVFLAFAGNVDDDQIEFNWLIALIAGGYLVYVMISFCFDLAVRVVKLAFYQIIAPIAIACRILPDKESIFKNWYKASLKTYFSVFIRVLVMNLGVYLIAIFIESNFFQSTCANNECTGILIVVAYAMIILGIVTFIRQAPKLLDEVFGLGMGDMKLGIKDKLKQGGAFTAGAAIGAGATAMTRNATHAIGNVRDAKGFTGKVAAISRGIGSTVSGAVMGSYRGGRSGWKASSVSDMAKAASKGAAETIQRRDDREAYRASHNLGNLSGSTPFIGGIASAAGHVIDTARGVKRWAGIGNVDALIAQNKQIDAISSAVDAVKDTARDVMISDATVKNKTLTYGISSTLKHNFSMVDDTGTTQTFQIGFNTEEYRKMDRLVKQARAAGDEFVTYSDGTNTHRVSTAELEAAMGGYAKSFSEQMANVAAQTSSDWKKYQDTNTTEAIALDKVRSKAVDLRNVLEQNLNSQVITNSNGVSSGQKIDPDAIRNQTLLFDGNNALGKLGDQAKLLRQSNNDKIVRRRAEEEKK